MLQLNNNQVLPIKEFYGRNTEQMPILIKEGRIPASLSFIFQKRLEVLTQDVPEEIKEAYLDNYFDTDTTFLYHPEGNIKIVQSPGFVRSMNSESELKNGALVVGSSLDEGISIYNSFDVPEFTRDELKKYANNRKSISEAKSCPILAQLVPDQDLRNESIDAIFSEGKRRHDVDNMVGIYVGSPVDGVVGARLAFPNNVYNFSSVIGNDIIGNYGGRLLGVVPEALGLASDS